MVLSFAIVVFANKEDSRLSFTGGRSIGHMCIFMQSKRVNKSDIEFTHVYRYKFCIMHLKRVTQYAASHFVCRGAFLLKPC